MYVYTYMHVYTGARGWRKVSRSNRAGTRPVPGACLHHRLDYCCTTRGPLDTHKTCTLNHPEPRYTVILPSQIRAPL